MQSSRIVPLAPLRQAARRRNPQRAITATRSIFSRRAASSGICSSEHDSAPSTILGDTLPRTPHSPATTRIETVAESLTPLRAILETIRDNAQRALTLIGHTGEQRSLGWKCIECGHVKHFTRPVPPEVAPPCPKCDGNSFEPCWDGIRLQKYFWNGIFQIHASWNRPSRKDIELLRCDFRSAASHCDAQRLCSPFPEMQSSRIVPLASAPACCAVPYSTTRDHCGWLRMFFARILKLASYPVAKMRDDYGT